MAWSASDIVASLTCERSTTIPRRFISCTTSRPNDERPRRAVSVEAVAQGRLRQCVSVMYRTPSAANIRNAPREFSMACPPSMPIRHEIFPALKFRSTSAAR